MNWHHSPPPATLGLEAAGAGFPTWLTAGAGCRGLFWRGCVFSHPIIVWETPAGPGTASLAASWILIW